MGRGREKSPAPRRVRDSATLGHTLKGGRDGEGEYLEEGGKAIWFSRAALDKAVEPKRRELKTYTMAEVERHCTPDDLWVVVDRHVYNVTPFRLNHPGGRLPLENMAGKDATDPFSNYHPAHVYTDMMSRYCIGRLAPDKQTLREASPLMADFRELRQQLLEEGMYETKWDFYARQAVWLAWLFAMALHLTLNAEADETWKRMLGACFMAAFWQQLAFPGHDTGHNAITHQRIIDNLLGICVGNLLGGVSIGWWKWSHNTHHIVCNSIEHDPDIQHLPVFAVSAKILRRFWSTFHSKWMEVGTVARWLLMWQHVLYYPIMAVARFNLYVQSYILLLSNERFPFKRLEIVANTLFLVWMGVLMSTLPTWGEVAGWLLLSHGISGILHVQITLSHFSMDTYHGHTGHAHYDDDDCWFRMQLATSMDIKSNWLTEWFHGGLQYQIEHHLFPRVPRHNLRAVQKHIMALCEKHGVHYHLLSFWDANVEVLGALRDAANAAAAAKPGEVSGEGVPHMVWDGLNARG